VVASIIGGSDAEGEFPKKRLMFWPEDSMIRPWSIVWHARLSFSRAPWFSWGWRDDTIKSLKEVIELVTRGAIGRSLYGPDLNQFISSETKKLENSSW